MITATVSSYGTNGYRFIFVLLLVGVPNATFQQANGPLTQENVFEYFATSMFYDKQSNNQVLRMQTQHAVMPSASTESEESKLE